MRSCDIHCVNRRIKALHIFIKIRLPLSGKTFRAIPVRIEYSLHIDTADKFRFRNEPSGDPSAAYNPNPADPLLLTSKHRTGNIFCPVQVYDPAIIFQIVENSGPVRTHCKNINLIFSDIQQFLSFRTLYNNFICEAGFTDIFNSRYQGIHHIEFPSGLIIFFCCNPHDQIIPQLLRPL